MDKKQVLKTITGFFSQIEAFDRICEKPPIGNPTAVQAEITASMNVALKSFDDLAKFIEQQRDSLRFETRRKHKQVVAQLWEGKK